MHLLVEAVSAYALASGMKSIGSRFARAVNRVFRRRGLVLADRFQPRLRVVGSTAGGHSERRVWSDHRQSLRGTRGYCASDGAGTDCWIWRRFPDDHPASNRRWKKRSSTAITAKLGGRSDFAISWKPFFA